MQRKVSQVVSREWILFSTICLEQVQSHRVTGALAGLVRVAALPLLPAMEEAPSQWLDLCFRVLASISSCCVKNNFSHF